MAASAKAKSKHCIVITSHSHHSCDICSRIQPLVIELWLTKKEEEEEEGELESEKSTLHTNATSKAIIVLWPTI